MYNHYINYKPWRRRRFDPVMREVRLFVFRRVNNVLSKICLKLDRLVREGLTFEFHDEPSYWYCNHLEGVRDSDMEIAWMREDRRQQALAGLWLGSIISLIRIHRM